MSFLLAPTHHPEAMFTLYRINSSDAGSKPIRNNNNSTYLTIPGTCRSHTSNMMPEWNGQEGLVN